MRVDQMHKISLFQKPKAKHNCLYFNVFFRWFFFTRTKQMSTIPLSCEDMYAEMQIKKQEETINFILRAQMPLTVH